MRNTDNLHTLALTQIVGHWVPDWFSFKKESLRFQRQQIAAAP